MRLPRTLCVALLLIGSLLWSASAAFASAYNARPKLIVVIIIDQFRGDYLERYRDQFGEGGFRLFLEHGAYFTDCNYDYANTRTAPDTLRCSRAVIRADTASLRMSGGIRKRRRW